MCAYGSKMKIDNIKRVFDIILSTAGIFLTSPVWIIAIIGILVSDFGPVFYVAKRYGKQDKLFGMYKFRSMRIDKKANEKCLKADKARIFAFGQFMRRTKIDELPQLINILKGEMSFVGPRPVSIDQYKIIRSDENKVLCKLTPGLTSPSAIYDYLYGDKVEDEQDYIEKVLPTRLKLDIIYMHKRGICYDIELIILTILSVVGTIMSMDQKFILDRVLKDI